MLDSGGEVAVKSTTEEDRVREGIAAGDLIGDGGSKNSSKGSGDSESIISY